MNFRVTWFRLVFALLVGVLGSFPALTSAQSEKVTLGWLEKVKLSPGGLIIHAKLDSGADNSSLHASDVEEFQKTGKRWVRFGVTDRYGRKSIIEKEVRRVAIVKNHSGKLQKRQVIRLGLCLASVYLETDVSLVDRTNFDYQLLVGRSFLAGNVLVDSAVSYTKDPECVRAQ